MKILLSLVVIITCFYFWWKMLKYSEEYQTIWYFLLHIWFAGMWVINLVGLITHLITYLATQKPL